MTMKRCVGVAALAMAAGLVGGIAGARFGDAEDYQPQLVAGCVSARRFELLDGTGKLRAEWARETVPGLDAWRMLFYDNGGGRRLVVGLRADQNPVIEFWDSGMNTKVRLGTGWGHPEVSVFGPDNWMAASLDERGVHDLVPATQLGESR